MLHDSPTTRTVHTICRHDKAHSLLFISNSRSFTASRVHSRPSSTVTYENLLLLDEHLKACTYKGASTARVLALRTVRIDSVRRSVLGALRGLARATRVGVAPPEELRCTSCSICLEDFTKGELALRLPCGHLFHGPCIGTWLSSSSACPNCRKGDGLQ